MKVELELDCSPVSWSNGKPLKYRAMGSVKIDADVKNVYGDPKPSPREAWKSLKRECDLWEVATARIRRELQEALKEETE